VALSATRVEYRIALCHSDRGVDVSQTVVLGRHPSETAIHLTLRALTWCLLYEERLSFGPGLSERDAADLWTHDLTGRLSTWIECGNADSEKLKKVVQHNRDAGVHVVFGAVRAREEFLEGVARWDGQLPKGWERVSLWTIDPELVTALAGREDRRQRWAVTVVGDHMYIDADGAALSGEVKRG